MLSTFFNEKRLRKMLTKLTAGVNFINSFTYKFFVRTLFRQLFLVMFWLRQKIRTKNACVKSLMKLTAVCHSAVEVFLLCICLWNTSNHVYYHISDLDKPNIIWRLDLRIKTNFVIQIFLLFLLTFSLNSWQTLKNNCCTSIVEIKTP